MKRQSPAFSVVKCVLWFLVLDSRQRPATGLSWDFVVASFVTDASFGSFLTPTHWWGARAVCLYCPVLIWFLFG